MATVIKKQPSRGKKISIVLLRAGISFGVLAALFHFIPFEDFLQAVKSIPLYVWGTVLAFFITGHFFSALKWRLVISASGFIIPTVTAVKAHAAGLFANLCLPSIIGGDVIRAGMAVKQQGNLEAVTVGSLMDRINDTLALILIASIASMFITEHISVEIKHAFIIISSTVILAVITTITAIKMIPVEKFPAVLKKLIGKIKVALDSLLSQPFTALIAFSLSLSVQTGFIILNIMLAEALGIQIQHALWFWAWPLAKLIALVPISLGGLGVREAMLAGLLTPFGVTTTLAVSQGLLWQSVLIATGLISGLLVLISTRDNAGDPEIINAGEHQL